MKKLIFLTNFILTSALFGMQNECTSNNIQKFHQAVMDHNLAEIEHQIDKGISIDVITEAFMYAVYKDDFFTVMCLLAGCPDVNKIDDEGRTALMYAAGHGDDRMVDRLLRAGIEVNRADNKGRTALMYAASNGDNLTIDRLLEEGADVNQIDLDGKTAWAHATQKGHHIPALKSDNEKNKPSEPPSSPEKSFVRYTLYDGNNDCYLNLATGDIEWLPEEERSLAENENLYYWY